MPPTRRTLLQASALGVAGSFAGCAGASESRQDTETTTDSTGETTTAEAATTGFTVQVTTHPEYGVILTDDEGMTLYLFTQDSEGESTCYDDCAEAWPPLTVEGSVSVPDGLPGEVGTTERRDGSMQVTYNGMPLYYFANDQQPGDATGQGANDVWFVVHPACPGAAETTTPDGATETTTTEEGYGVGY